MGTKSTQSSSHKSTGQRVNVWTMIRDVFVASINKGQFPLALAGFITLFALLKMPGDDVSKLVFRVFDAIENGCLVGYVLFFVTAGVSYVQFRKLRLHIQIEADEIAKIDRK